MWFFVYDFLIKYLLFRVSFIVLNVVIVFVNVFFFIKIVFFVLIDVCFWINFVFVLVKSSLIIVVVSLVFCWLVKLLVVDLLGYIDDSFCKLSGECDFWIE